jgi:hypothetical protein
MNLLTDPAPSHGFREEQDIWIFEPPDVRWRRSCERLSGPGPTVGRGAEPRATLPHMVAATMDTVPAPPWNIPPGEWVEPTAALGGSSAVTKTSSEEERTRFLQKMDRSVVALEEWLGSSAARHLEPRQYGFVRAQARLMLAQCEVVAAAIEGGIEAADAATRQYLEDLGDRLDEIIDTLAWSTEAGDKLSTLIQEETCE